MDKISHFEYFLEQTRKVLGFIRMSCLEMPALDHSLISGPPFLAVLSIVSSTKFTNLEPLCIDD